MNKSVFQITMRRSTQIQTRMQYQKTAMKQKEIKKTASTKRQDATQTGTRKSTEREAPENWTGEVVYLKPADYEQPTQKHPVDV